MSDTTSSDTILIAAVAANGVIGDDGDMPWHYPEDLKHFKDTTVGNPVIMGWNTFQSIVSRIGGPLPDRFNIVLTRNHQDAYDGDGIDVATSISEAIRTAEGYVERFPDAENVYVIGGGGVYSQFIEHADRLILTEIEEAYDGDTRFPVVDDSEWSEVSRDERDEFSFVEYRRWNL